MIKPSLPQDRAALIDKDFRVTLPYRRWMNDLTRLALELQAAGAGTGTTTDPLAFTITGSGWISVTGSIESGNFSVTQRTGLTTADLTEGSRYYANHSAGAFDFTTDANYTLTATEYRNASLTVTDSGAVLTTGRDLVFPDAFPLLLLKNDTAQTLTLKKTGQTGVTVAAGALSVIAPGLTDVEKA